MARKRRRLTLKKKTTNKADKKAPGGLSQQQFASLAHEYSSFVAEDPDHEPIEYARGDVVLIQYQDVEDSATDLDPADHWVGEIQEIKGNNADDVWIRVQWFWSPDEVAEVIKSFDPTICGKHEKLTSDNCDIISVHCVVGHAEVKSFDETSICQAPIGDDELFSRFNFQYDAKRISPKVTYHACSICRVPYTPGELKIHHFCPRPLCRQFYHQSCLVKNSYVCETPRHRVLETWPNIDRTVPLEEFRRVNPPTKRLKKDGSASTRSTVSDPLADIPPMLVAIANQQIVRGGEGWGIVGNITSVTAARSLIHKTFEGNGVIPDDWETRIDASNASLIDTDTLPNCFCPSCYSPI